MGELTPKELALLANIDENEELRPFFLRKAKGIKWFDALYERGYFDPAGNLPPQPAKEEGYVNIPFWPVTEYLVNTSPEFLLDENRSHAERVLDTIRNVTLVAKEHEFGNYRTWWQFAKIIQNIPLDLIEPQDLEHVDYWLDDKYERGLLAEELGEQWLLSLLDQPHERADAIALGLLRMLYRPVFSTKRLLDSEYQEAAFRFDKWHAEKITRAVPGKAGRKLGEEAVQVFVDGLASVLDVLGRDHWSSLWQPAIEDHDQNEYRDDVENWLTLGLRDSLGSWVQEDPQNAVAFVEHLLEMNSHILKRVAMHTIRVNFHLFDAVVDRLIAEELFEDDFRHEMWHLLRERYPLFPEPQRQRVLEIVDCISVEDDDGNPSVERTAYRQAIWLAAIKNFGQELQANYQACVDLAGAEPDHPDFSSYFSSGWLVRDSPLPADELLAMNTDQLIEYLQTYEDPGTFMESGLEGLVDALKAAVKSAPMQYAPSLTRFALLDSAYVYVLLEAFNELWSEKKELPWAGIWQELLNFCQLVIENEEFWSPANMGQRPQFVANRFWVVGAIGRLIESGTKSDDHAFSPELLPQARELLLALLEKEQGQEFKPDSDAVSIAINSPRGRCLEALVNLALRSCRLADKEAGGHDAVWASLEPIFDLELLKPDEDEYEFITLLVNYLPNFLYMSREWVLANLALIFDFTNYQKWLCAMQAYAYVNKVYQEVYRYLKDNEHFLRALDDENLKERVSEKIIQGIVVAYISDFEDLEENSSLIRQLIVRAKADELSRLIWFIWTLRDKDKSKLHDKVMDLWPELLRVVDTSTREGRKLASRLTTWSVFVSEVDDTSRELILQVAAYAEEDYNSHELLETMARISAGQPYEAAAIWEAILQRSAPDYPEWAIREAFSNLVRAGDEGRRTAFSIADQYIKRGNEKPRLYLSEIVG
jgi:hypothetical protein